MSDDTDSADPFAEALARLEEEVGGTTPPETGDTTTTSDVPEEDIPDVGYERSPEDEALDQAVASLDILEAYRRYCGKSDPRVRGSQTESIMISCPKPNHPDKNPSAWINTDKQVWHCATCGEGGDKFDIAAWHFGFDVPGYKGKDFPALKKRIAEDMGWSVTTTLGGKTLVSAPATDGSETSEPEEPASSAGISTSPSTGTSSATSADPQDDPAPDPTGSAVLTLVQDPDTDALLEFPTVPWQDILGSGETFMSRWMEVTSVDDLPEEYYFWLGMMAVGFAVGREVVLADNPEVRANLFVCLYGHTGLGKSRSIGTLINLLREALPFDHDDPKSNGTYLMPSPGSAETLIDGFGGMVVDPTTSISAPRTGVRGLVRFDELATLMGRANRAGNPMKPALMELFDAYHDVEHRSRGGGLVTAREFYCSVLTTTQPKSIRQLMVQADADSGFANRWIFAAGAAKEKVAYGRQRIDVTECVDPLRRIRSWAQGPAGTRYLDLDGAALTMWENFFHGVLVPAQEEDDTNLLTRADLMLKKCIVLIASDRQEAAPSKKTVEDALRLWPYLQKSYGLVSPEVGVGEFEHVRQAIREAVITYEKRHKKAPTLRRITGALARRKYPGDLMVRVIRTMVELEELEEVTSTNLRGPKTVGYHYALTD